MVDFSRTIACAGAALTSISLAVGCNSAHVPFDRRAPAELTFESTAAQHVIEPAAATVSLTAAIVPVQTDTLNDDPLSGQTELELARLTTEVRRRNPSVQAMIATANAAAQRYPQAIALDDPMFGFMVAPGSLGSGSVDFGWMVEGSQKIPWPGKRHLRGQKAEAEADASYQEIEEVRLKLSEMTAMAFLEYYVASRELELNTQNLDKLKIIRESAYTNLKANKVDQRDVFDVEVQLQLLDQRQVELKRMRKVATARINTLLHRVPDHPLPPAPQSLPDAKSLPAAEILRKFALERRPDLAALAARIRAEEAAVELASREFKPDLEFVARYDGFWQGADRDLAPQIGLNLNWPIQKERRRAAVEEAMQNVARRRAEYSERVDAIQEAVEITVERLDEARAAIDRYAAPAPHGIIAKAESNAESARNSYGQAATDFLRLIDSQRQLIGYRDKLVEAEAEYHRRLAELERAIGGAIPATHEIEEGRDSSSRPDQWRAVADGPALK